jgi:3-methyladenine DNA glycosylase AlkC
MNVTNPSGYVPLKYIYSAERLDELGQLLRIQYPSFAHTKWMSHFQTEEWHQAELKQRVSLVAHAFYAQLPNDYNTAIDILIPVSQQMAYGYFGVIFSEYVALYGRKHWDKSMKAMAIFTQTSTAEFAIRYFIQDDPKRAMQQMTQWSKDRNHHIRRLSSEGCRPRLPWGMKLQLFIDDPKPTLSILERLKADPELYVRKSVANHLNDISKDNPEVAIETAQKWIGTHRDTDWIVKHGLRGLLKAGHPEALALFGQEASAHLTVEHCRLHQSELTLGDVLQFEVRVQNQSDDTVKLRLEYAIDYVKANGKTSRKVFQWTAKEVDPGIHTFKKRQVLKDFTTRKHYAGVHGWACLINGEQKASLSFTLVTGA